MQPSKKIYAPYEDGKQLLCSRCFSTLGSIEKYGHDDEGYWFIAPCKECKAKMKWYRLANGNSILGEKEEEDGTFAMTMVNGELTMVWETEK